MAASAKEYTACALETNADVQDNSFGHALLLRPRGDNQYLESIKSRYFFSQLMSTKLG